MFSDLCALARYLESISSTILDLERSAKIWKVKETSITDLIIASFRNASSVPWLEVDASHETTTNADFEIILRQAGRDFTILLQAKRSGKTQSGTANVPEVFHPKGTGNQNRLLIDFARKNKMLPLYAVYLSTLDVKRLVGAPGLRRVSGITLQHASELRRLGFNQSGKNTLLAHKLLEGAFPFRHLFCLELETHSLDAIARTLYQYASADLEFPLEDLITEEVTLEERGNRDMEVNRAYRLSERRSEDVSKRDTPPERRTQRILFNLDELL